MVKSARLEISMLSQDSNYQLKIINRLPTAPSTFGQNTTPKYFSPLPLLKKLFQSQAKPIKKK